MSSRKRLGQILLQQGVLDELQLAKGLDAQLQFEGRLGTNLLELGFVTEKQLTIALAEQHRVQAYGDDDLDLEPGVCELLRRKAATHYQAVPLRRTDGQRRLRLAMADPGNLQALDELALVVGLKIDPVAACELRVGALLEKHYGVERPQRHFVRVVQQAGDDTGSDPPARRRSKAPDLDPPGTAEENDAGKQVRVRFLTPPPPPQRERPTLNGPVLTEPERPAARLGSTPPSVAPDSKTRVALSLTKRLTLAPPAETPDADELDSTLEWDLQEEAGREGADSSPPVSEKSETRVSRELEVIEPEGSPRRGRLQAALAELSSIDDRDLAADRVLSYLAPSFDCGLILMVKNDVAFGWKGYCPNPEQVVVESVVIPLSAPSVFNTVFESGRAFCGAPDEQGSRIHGRLWKLLCCEAPQEVLIAPVVVASRLVNLIYAHPNPERKVRPVAQAHLMQLASATALAYRRAIKRAAS